MKVKKPLIILITFILFSISTAAQCDQNVSDETVTNISETYQRSIDAFTCSISHQGALWANMFMFIFIAALIAFIIRQVLK